MQKKIMIILTFILTLSTSASAEWNLSQKKEWYKNCSNKKVEDTMMKIYKTNFHKFHNVTFWQWVVEDIKYSKKPYNNKNSYFGKNKDVCSSSFEVIAQSSSDLKNHKFKVNFSMLFKGTKNKKGEDLFDSRVDSSTQVY